MTETADTDFMTNLLAHLSLQSWHDVTEHKGKIDPDAVRCLSFGYDGKRNGSTVWFLNRYEDEGDALCLSCHMRGQTKKVETDQDRLEWLWEQVA